MPGVGVSHTEGPLGSIFINPDGDRAEVSGKAMDLFRMLMGGNDSSPAGQQQPTGGPSVAAYYEFDLPNQLINWGDIRYDPGQVLGNQDWTLPGVVQPGIPSGNNMPTATASPETVMPAENAVSLEELEPSGSCQTCESRRYVDKSDDPSVSFQTPGKISPNMSAAVVAAHEREHVVNERSKAHRQGREIINQTVTLTYDCCPECGKSYVSGGTTRTTSVGKSEPDNNQQGETSGKEVKPD